MNSDTGFALEPFVDSVNSFDSKRVQMLQENPMLTADIEYQHADASLCERFYDPEREI
ncbi:MAG TPA: hypothetical protein VN380_15520 [Thermoanaerobaculia bacterium]|jgi:hypothetical protein|nr:hypothetical protein [Thermoanaerobaculia bacterium]